MTTATCRRCGVTVTPERPLDRVALVKLMDAHVCPIFDAEDERTWQWLLALLGLEYPYRATICAECGWVWPTGCHLTEGLAHLDSPEHAEGVRELEDQRLRAGPEHGGICEECGDDDSMPPYRYCTGCLEILAP